MMKQHPEAGAAVGNVPEIAEFVFEALQAASPDAPELSERLRSRLSLSAQDADRLLAGTVAAINRQLFPPITQLELILTEACNLRCRYCFETAMLGTKPMPAETAKQAIDLLLLYAADAPDVSVTLFGGEPTLRMRTIREIAEYARRQAGLRQKQIGFNMTTNGTLLTDKVIAMLAEYRISALLSLDGLGASHDRFRVDRKGRGTFGGVVRGLRRLKAVQPWIAAKMTVMPDNARRLCEDVRGLHDLGVNQFIIGHATGLRWQPADLDAFAAEWRKLHAWYLEHRGDDLLIEDFDKEEPKTDYFGCQAGRTGIAVSVGGDISPCSKLLSLDTRKALGRLGTLRYGLTHLANRRQLVGSERVRSAWAALDREETYRGGCFAENYEEHRDLFRPSLQEHRFSSLRAAVAAAAARG